MQNKTNWTWSEQGLLLRAGQPTSTTAKQTASKIQLDQHLAMSKWCYPCLAPERYVELVLCSLRSWKLHIADPLWGVSFDDWWIIPTKDQPVICKAFQYYYVVTDELVNVGWLLYEGRILLSHTDDLVIPPYDINIYSLSHTDGLSTPLYDIGIPLLCHTDDLLSSPYEITTVYLCHRLSY